MAFSKKEEKSKVTGFAQGERRLRRNPFKGSRLNLLRFKKKTHQIVMDGEFEVNQDSVEAVVEVMLEARLEYVDVEAIYIDLFGEETANGDAIIDIQRIKFDSQIFDILKNQIFEERRFSCGLIIEFINGNIWE